MSDIEYKRAELIIEITSITFTDNPSLIDSWNVKVEDNTEKPTTNIVDFIHLFDEIKK